MIRVVEYLMLLDVPHACRETEVYSHYDRTLNKFPQAYCIVAKSLENRTPFEVERIAHMLAVVFIRLFRSYKPLNPTSRILDAVRNGLPSIWPAVLSCGIWQSGLFGHTGMLWGSLKPVDGM